MLAGCGNNAIVESPLSSGSEADLSTIENVTKSDVFENSDTNSFSQVEQAPPQSDEKPAIEMIESPESHENTPSQQASETRTDTPVPQSEEPTSSPKPVEKPVASSPSETEPPIIDTIAEPVVTTEPTPEPQPVEPVKPQFDIQYWIGYAQSYAEGVGLHLNSEAVYCWDNPITAGVNSTCLDRDIQSRLGRYSRDEDITDVWIWSEPRSDGSYDLYIGYA